MSKVDRLTQGLARKIEQDGLVAYEPFPHLVMGRFLPDEIAATVESEFPGRGEAKWRQYRHKHSKKLACADRKQMGRTTLAVLDALNSRSVMDAVSKVMALPRLECDPRLYGGGMHRIEHGGYLGIHVDFNWHPKLRMRRKLNLLLFLNRNWAPEWGGALELRKDPLEKNKLIFPLYNRCVMFETSEQSWHGHPYPLQCPEGEARKSLALYYYTREPVEEAHGTIYRGCEH